VPANISAELQTSSPYTSFEKLYTWNSYIITWTSIDRKINISWDWIANPWFYNDFIAVESTWEFICVQSWLNQTFNISEVFLWSEDYASYIELQWLSDFNWTIIFSGTALKQEFTMSITMGYQDRIIISNSASWYRNLNKIITSDFDLISDSWTILIYGQSWQVLDSVVISNLTPSRSVYFTSSDECKRDFATNKNFSPALDDQTFFNYISSWISTTKVVYVWWGWSCPVCNSCPIVTQTGSAQQTGSLQQTGLVQNTGTNPIYKPNLKILSILYDPVWSDTDNEYVQLKSNEGENINLNSYRLQVVWQSTKKTIRWEILYANQSQIFVWNYQFPNDPHCVNLLLGEITIDQFCYWQSSIDQKTWSTINPLLSNLTWNNLSWNEISILSWIQSLTWISDIYSWLKFQILSITPNPEWADKLGEQITLGINNYEENKIASPTQMRGSQWQSETLNSINLSSWFRLEYWTHKKKLIWLLNSLTPLTITWDFQFPNKATCVYLFQNNIQLDKFCYPKPENWKTYYNWNAPIESISLSDFSILNWAKLEKIWNSLCLTYLQQTFICKTFPASKTSIKLRNENKLYESYIALLTNDLKNNWTTLYYNSDFKIYSDLFFQAKKELQKWNLEITLLNQTLPTYDLQRQFKLKSSYYFLTYISKLIASSLDVDQINKWYENIKKALMLEEL
jgi:hypothetical protein